MPIPCSVNESHAWHVSPCPGPVHFIPTYVPADLSRWGFRLVVLALHCFFQLSSASTICWMDRCVLCRFLGVSDLILPSSCDIKYLTSGIMQSFSS